jgi:hypothetical protein
MAGMSGGQKQQDQIADQIFTPGMPGKATPQQDQSGGFTSPQQSNILKMLGINIPFVGGPR